MEGWVRLLLDAREAGGLTQDALARRAGTSRPTLSAYEHGRKVPSAGTLERLLAAAGVRLEVAPVPVWRSVAGSRGRGWWVSDRLWRLPVDRALRDVVLPLELNWSDPGRVFAVSDVRQRARLYEIVLREGGPEQIEAYVDGVLLVDVWADLVLPRALRQAWQPTIEAATASGSRSALAVGL